jgi:hypothetical protein
MQSTRAFYWRNDLYFEISPDETTSGIPKERDLHQYLLVLLNAAGIVLVIAPAAACPNLLNSSILAKGLSV